MSDQIQQNHFCSNCGSRVTSAENFCRNCGAPLSTGSSSSCQKAESAAPYVAPGAFSFSGRASRSDFWTCAIFSFLYVFIISIFVTALLGVGSDAGLVLSLYVVSMIPIGIWAWAVQVRRCHDLGWSGWILVLGFIPVVGLILFIVLGLSEGNPEPNLYGPPPKGQSGTSPQPEAWPEPSPQWFLEDLVSIPISGGLDPFSLGRYPVTQAQWKAVMGRNPSWFNGADNPVEQVSWNDCQIFLEKLNALPAVKKSGLVFRLPTEEEWEYACRAGATGPYCKLADGTEITEHSLGRVAWFEDNSDDRTHSVGKKEPNAFGLYDMQGNVWEWTQTMDGDNRIDRGGGWSGSAVDCESSFRDKSSSRFRGRSLGFRLCASGRAD